MFSETTMLLICYTRVSVFVPKVLTHARRCNLPPLTINGAKKITIVVVACFWWWCFAENGGAVRRPALMALIIQPLHQSYSNSSSRTGIAMLRYVHESGGLIQILWDTDLDDGNSESIPVTRLFNLRMRGHTLHYF